MRRESCSVLYRMRVFFAYSRLHDIYDAILYRIVYSVYTCLLPIYAFTIVIKTCLPPADRHIAGVS